MFRPISFVICLCISLSALGSELSVLSWNTFLMPDYLRKAYHDERLPSLVKALEKSDYDIIMLQEVFTRKSYKKLNKSLSERGYYTTGYPFRSIYKPFNSGLVIFSKFPMSDVEIMLFDKLAAADKFSSKGVLFAKAHLPDGKVVQLATTHFQAKKGEKYRKIRKSHISQIMKSFKKHISPEMPVIFGGDFNIGSNYGAEADHFFNAFKKLGLATTEPKGHLHYTSDCIGNSLKNHLNPTCDSRKQVDYIFARSGKNSSSKNLNSGEAPIGDLLVLDIEADYRTDDGVKRMSLSDHLSVEAKISF